MKLSIVGTGYVGLVTGTCFAEVGHHVICVDNDVNKVKMLQAGGIPIYEPGLEEMVKKNVAAGRLSFTASIAEGVEKARAAVQSGAARAKLDALVATTRRLHDEDAA